MAWHLAALCVALAIPVLAVGCLLALSEADADRTRAKNQALGIAREVTASVDRELASMIATAEVLSLSHQLQTGDLAGFDHQARIVSRLLGVNVVLRDGKSRQVVDTRDPRGALLPSNGGAESDSRVLQTRKPNASDLLPGGLTKEPLFIASVSVFDGDRIIYFLGLSVEPHRIRSILLQSGATSSAWAITVADRGGMAIASTSPQEAGQPAWDLPLPTGQEREANTDERDHSGSRSPALIATVRSQITGWTTMVEVPVEHVWPRLSQLVLGVGGAGAAILMVLIGMAIAFSRRVEKPVAALAAQAALLGRGETVQKLLTPVREVNVLSVALSEASEKRHAVEAALRSSEERLQLAQSAGRIGTWDWDAGTGRLTCSEIYCRLYGLDPTGPGHRNVEEWISQVHPDDQARVQWIRNEALATRHIESEYRILRRDGSIRWVVDRGMALPDAGHRFVRIIGATLDVTESRDAAERVRELQFELLHASRLSAMGQMAASLAHELNQPLGAAATFLGAAQMAFAGAKPDASARAAARIAKATQQMMRAGAIVRRLRDFTRRGEIDKRIADPRNLIVEAVALALVDMKDRGLRIRYEFDPETRSVLVDRIQLQQVVFNLVRNALEATSASEQREIVLRTRATGQGQVEMSVADTGSGLPADPETLFEPFVSSKPEGMGIGLSICRTIIEAHHGRLWAEPNPKGGAIFRFVIPAADELETKDDQE